MVEVAVDRIVDPLDRAAQLPVGLLGNLLGVPNGLVVDAGLVEERCYVFLGLVLRPGLDGIVDGALILGLDAVVVLRERRREVLRPDHAAQLLEVLVRVGRDEDVPHLGLLRVLGAWICLLYTSPSPRDRQKSRMPSSA